jgi:predicted PurR-regulated permease PerM
MDRSDSIESGTSDSATPRRPFRVSLALFTGIGIILTLWLALPLLPALAWATALTVISLPLHLRIARTIPSANWAAGISTIAVVGIVVLPMVFVATQVGREATETSRRVQALAAEGRIDAAVDRVPRGTEALAWVRQNVDFQVESRRLLDSVLGAPTELVRGSVWFLVQILVAVFVLFFAFRDWRHLLAAMERLSPLERWETNRLFDRIAGSIHATVYATVVTGVVQGITGGLMFWLLGLPGPVLWGTVITVLGILPILGAFLVWVPACVLLILDDRWGAAIALATWAIAMSGPILNWMYAWLAGDRMKLHAVPVLIAFVGGIALFGISGMVIGPAILAVTMGLIEVWSFSQEAGESSTAKTATVTIRT